MWLAEKGGYLYSHPYDLGAYENIISVRNCLLSSSYLPASLTLLMKTCTFA